MKSIFIFLSKVAFAVLMVAQCGCHHIDSNEITDSTVTHRDTTLFICGVQHQLSVPVSLTRVDLEDFLHFNELLCDSELIYDHVSQIDTTGDGKLEEVKSHVALVDDCVHIQNTIKNEEGTLLWKDELAISKSEAEKMFEDKLTFHQLYPISAMYVGRNTTFFVDELNHHNFNFDEKKKNLLRIISGVAEQNELLSLYESELADKIEAYRGKYIFSLSSSRPDIYMWDEDKNQFVLLTV